VYSWLTIATTTDVRLVTNSASSPLPIIGTEIPVVGFYWAPALLLAMYLYRFSWGQGNLRDAGETRKRYIDSLHAADRHDIGPLLLFARA
jgi:hypothetical protein